MSIDSYRGLTQRAINVLKNENFHGPNDVAQVSEAKLREIPNLGAGTLANIKEWLASHGLHLQGEEIPEQVETITALERKLYARVRTLEAKLAKAKAEWLAVKATRVNGTHVLAGLRGAEREAAKIARWRSFWEMRQQGKTYKEIGKAFGIGPGYANIAVHRYEQHLKKRGSKPPSV